MKMSDFIQEEALGVNVLRKTSSQEANVGPKDRGQNFKCSRWYFHTHILYINRFSAYKFILV